VSARLIPVAALRRVVAEDRGFGPVDVDTLPRRPVTRGDCIGGPRPCPWVSCRHHLYLDVDDEGGLRLNHPDLEPGELEESCALDVADRGEHYQEEVGALLGISRQRVRAIEAEATGNSWMKPAALVLVGPLDREVTRGIRPEDDEESGEESG
jgi:hypothetical protein